MQIQPINNANTKHHQKINTVTLTGYASLGFGIASGLAAAGKKKKLKLHKTLAYISGAMALIHTGIIEWYKFNRKNNLKKG